MKPQLLFRNFLAGFLTGFFLQLPFLYAQPVPVTVSTFAGTGIAGFTDGNALTTAQFKFPIGVGLCVGPNGVIYVADRENHAIRKIENGMVTTIAGNGTVGYADGIGQNAKFNFPNGLTIDGSSNIYVADAQNQVIRKISPQGVVTTLAGIPGSAGYQDGPGSSAQFIVPYGIEADNSGNIYVSELGNSDIRKIDSNGNVSTFAGQPMVSGYADGPANTSLFERPAGLAFDNNGNLYVTEEGNHTIRKITPGQIVSTVAGVNHIAAGPGNGGYADGNAFTEAEFNTPSGIVVDNSGNIL